uniref:Uncharacterized protein n=1 Tax=Ditylenchus dipsaci TaxID=166011 RepID=A0A915DJS1_9BILA
MTEELRNINNAGAIEIHPASRKSVEIVQPESFKKLAASVANEDPGYQESENNPFASHIRYRSIRKMKTARLNCISTTESMLSSTSTNEASCYPITSQLLALPKEKDFEACLYPPHLFSDFTWIRQREQDLAWQREQQPIFSYTYEENVCDTGFGRTARLAGQDNPLVQDYDDKFTSWRCITNRRHTMQRQSSQTNFESPETLTLPSNFKSLSPRPTDPSCSTCSSPYSSSRNSSSSSYYSSGKSQVLPTPINLHSNSLANGNTHILSATRNRKSSIGLPESDACTYRAL